MASIVTATVTNLRRTNSKRFLGKFGSACCPAIRAPKSDARDSYLSDTESTGELSACGAAVGVDLERLFVSETTERSVIPQAVFQRVRVLAAHRGPLKICQTVVCLVPVEVIDSVGLRGPWTQERPSYEGMYGGPFLCTQAMGQTNSRVAIFQHRFQKSFWINADPPARLRMKTVSTFPIRPWRNSPYLSQITNFINAFPVHDRSPTLSRHGRHSTVHR